MFFVFAAMLMSGVFLVWGTKLFNPLRMYRTNGRSGLFASLSILVTGLPLLGLLIGGSIASHLGNSLPTHVVVTEIPLEGVVDSATGETCWLFITDGEAFLTPNPKYVLSKLDDGVVCVWRAEEIQLGEGSARIQRTERKWDNPPTSYWWYWSSLKGAKDLTIVPSTKVLKTTFIPS